MAQQSREYIVLRYLADKMEANSKMIGEAIAKSIDSDSIAFSALAAQAIGSLHKKSWITRIPELRAWRITREGRIALEEEKENVH